MGISMGRTGKHLEGCLHTSSHKLIVGLFFNQEKALFSHGLWENNFTD